MLDPLSALSLACNVIQIVDFSLKALSKFRELYKDGVSSEDRELEDTTSRLKDLRANLTNVDPVTRASNPVSFDDRDLQAIANACCETAEELTSELDTLKVSGPYKKRQAARKILRSMWRKSVVEEIQRKLDRYQKVLDTKILVNLRQRIDLAALQQDDRFSNLDSKVQVLIVSLEKQQSSFGVLSDLIQEEHKSAREHVTQEFHQHRRDRERDEYCNRYLHSLSFPGMHARQEIMTEAFEETFQWIFAKPDKAVRPWGNFAEWLKNGQGIYWIQGKPGSGKSTLMSYIFQDERTKALLKAWTGTLEPLIVSFFFWKAGNDSPLQKSSAGLLRSLLHQILEKLPSLVLSTAQTDADLQGFQHGVDRLPSIPVWTEKRLLTTFRKLLAAISSSYRLCLFIDGLDEIDGSQTDLVELLVDRVTDPNIKMCLSSRPDRCFIDAFTSPAMLRLEDLTRKDIELYISSKLERACRQKRLVSNDQYWVSRMTSRLVQKSRGVFQWVHIVVEYLIQGLQSNDSKWTLEKRLELIPEEIVELYKYMLGKIDKVHRQEVASYLQIILQVHRTPSISELTLALYEGRDKILSQVSTFPLVEIASQCTSVRERIKLICGGLLEFRDRHDQSSESEDIKVGPENGNPSDQREPTISTPGSNAFQRAMTTFLSHRATRIHLIHRTAYDFLRDDDFGKDFVESNTPPTFDVYGSYIEARLAHLVILAQNEDFFVQTEDYPYSPDSESSSDTESSFDPPENSPSASSRSSVASIGSLIPKRNESSFSAEINKIMRLAVFVESETDEAHTVMNEKIDKVVTLLDQQYLREKVSDTHWCTRWGPPRLERDWSGRSCRDIQDAPAVPFDFLSLAVYHSLNLYVLDALPRRFELDDPDIMTCLLRLKLRSYGFLPSNLRLEATLLRRGAKANALDSADETNSTMWSRFLLQWISWQRIFRNESGDVAEQISTEKEWAFVARTFIESGADVNVKIRYEYESPFVWIISEDNATDFKTFKRVNVIAYVSVLAFLQNDMDFIPGSVELREMCVTRGASLTIRSRAVFVQQAHCHYSYELKGSVAGTYDTLLFATYCHEAGRPLPQPIESLRELLLSCYDNLRLRLEKSKDHSEENFILQ